MSKDESGDDRVAILLCTCNGGQYLRRQMESYFTQVGAEWELWISDDGSTDDSLDIVEEYRGRGRSIRVVEGPRAGFAANFLTLTRRPDMDARYFAWSDQDDVWLPDKLARAVRRLKAIPQSVPAVYCGRTIITDAAGRRLGVSPLPRRPLGFRNALCQNIAGGNTMVFNQAARRILGMLDPALAHTHDWLAYLAISAVGGEVAHDPAPVLRYRQHSNNVLGANLGVVAKFHRLRRLLTGEFRQRCDMNLAALEAIGGMMTETNKETLEKFGQARRCRRPLRRWRLYRESKAYRQSAADTMALALAVWLDRFP